MTESNVTGIMRLPDGQNNIIKKSRKVKHNMKKLDCTPFGGYVR